VTVVVVVFFSSGVEREKDFYKLKAERGKGEPSEILAVYPQIAIKS
jgi:hypothetical protein